MFNCCVVTKTSIDQNYRKMSKIEWLQETNSLDVYQSYVSSLTGRQECNTDQCSFIVFANTECNHCIEELAKIFKILDELNVNEEYIDIYNVNDDFEEVTGEYKNYDIYSVPTLFIKKNGILKGKSEGPIFTWEKDIINYCND